MEDTKEKILIESLKLFSKKGYEAVSVQDIADKLGITKGALYKHYKNKQDIFDSIVNRMVTDDAKRAKEYDVPVESFDNAKESYGQTTLDEIKEFSIAQFMYWVEDEFASNFRKMLVLEQYKDEEMSNLYQNYLGSGPLCYTEDLFREILGENKNYKELALKFYGPMYMLMNIYDSVQNKAEVISRINKHICSFLDELKGEN